MEGVKGGGEEERGCLANECSVAFVQSAEKGKVLIFKLFTHL